MSQHKALFKAYTNVYEQLYVSTAVLFITQTLVITDDVR
jgi:hypothetical protein